MIYNLSSDYHLGTKRQAHTTPESAKRLQGMLYTQALVATQQSNNICLGDMFDKSWNDEATLVQGFNIANRCRRVLSGNHDETNRLSATTTLQALKEMGAPVVSAPDLSTPWFETLDEYFWIVPHHASQAIFEEALEEAATDATRSLNHDSYLLLHCNYDVPFDTQDSTLNLTPEMVERLLLVFRRIFIGHEHNSKTLHGGRLVLVGNTHPTSFSDVSDKFRWELDAKTDELTPVKIWDEATNYREVVYGEPIPDLTNVQFVDVIGTQPAEDAAAVAQFIREVWDSGTSMLLAVRNRVEIIDHLRDVGGVDTSKPALVDLKQRIHDDLEGSDLQGVYQRLLSRAEEA